VISNVPGPQISLYCAGARMVANFPVSVITDGMGLNITVMSYCGSLDFGIISDRDQMPDLWNLIDWLKEELAELAPPPSAPSSSPAPRRRRSTPSARSASTNGAQRPTPAKNR